MIDAAPWHHTLRVYWEDTDAVGVAFYANYRKFFERARAEWRRAKGVAQHRLREETGAMFIVTGTTLRYLAPARLDDQLRITVLPIEIGRASMTLQQQAWKLAGNVDGEESTLLCEGRIRIGCVDATSFRPRRFPLQVTQTLHP